MVNKFTHENDVDDFVKSIFASFGFKKHVDYNEQRECGDSLKNALKGSSKTEQKSGVGIPDFTIEKYTINRKNGKANNVIPILIENKLKTDKLCKLVKNSDNISNDTKDVSKYAVNGALFYANSIIASGKYNEAIAIGVAGNSAEEVKIQVLYVFGSSFLSCKVTDYTDLNFLQSQASFEAFYKDILLSEEDKHLIIERTQFYLQTHAKQLNKLMHSLNITAPQRVLYVSGMLLSMQDYVDEKGELKVVGLGINDLKDLPKDNTQNGKTICNNIEEFLKIKIPDTTKRQLVLQSFNEIQKDPDRDKISGISTATASQSKNAKLVSNILTAPASTNKQIFAYIYEHIFRAVQFEGHSDIMGEMYSEFLKFALGDGKELGIVLTPPYVTKMMSQILEIDCNSRVMDLATGSAGFLISAMELMIEDANNTFTKGTKEAEQKIKELKRNQLLGVELNAEMFALACTNMILRGDGSSNIQKANTFSTPPELYESFKATKLLLNPPFTFDGNGMPFIEFGLKKMQKGGLGAIIIQDSAGSGQAVSSNQNMLKNNTLVASIKMPIDLFQPMAGVQTSIYVLQAGIPHDYEKTVKFIDFSNDGYKRTKRGIQKLSEPETRYQDIIKIYKAGKAAQVSSKLWDLDTVYIEDFISDSGKDWNFEQHQKIDTTPTEADFMNTVKDYLAWKVAQVLKAEDSDNVNF